LGDVYNISHGSSNNRLVGGNYIKEKASSVRRGFFVY